MCMALPDGEPLTADEIANMWKEVTANSPEVEQHRLKCTMPINVTTAIINNDTSSGLLNVTSSPNRMLSRVYFYRHLCGFFNRHNIDKHGSQRHQTIGSSEPATSSRDHKPAQRDRQPFESAD